MNTQFAQQRVRNLRERAAELAASDDEQAQDFAADLEAEADELCDALARGEVDA